MLNRPTFGGHIKMSLVFFILLICKMKKIMKEKNQVVPDAVLRKEILFQKVCLKQSTIGVVMQS